MDDLTLARFALSLIHYGDLIESMDERSVAADECRRWLPMAKSLMFSAANWPFARRYTPLTPLPSPTATPWAYAYRYPNDAITIWRVSTAQDKRTEAPFEVGSDAAGRLIYTDQGQAVAEFTAAVQETLFYPPTFCAAVYTQLAVFLCTAIADKKSYLPTANKAHLDALSIAKAHAANEGKREPEREPDLIEAHY